MFFLEIFPTIYNFLFVSHLFFVFFLLVLVILFFVYSIYVSLYNVYTLYKVFFFVMCLFFLFIFTYFVSNRTMSQTVLSLERQIYGFTIPLSFFVDNISIFFSYLIFLILFGVFSFSYYYMLKEKKHFKFLIMLVFFSSVMLFFFHSNNILVYLFFWKLIGIFSFFLIGYYNTKTSSFKSALKAMFFNIISDFIFLLFVITYYKTYHTFEILNLVLLQACDGSFGFFFFEITKQNLLIALIISFSCVKSAQGVSYIWLIDSMDAPAPASALIHSATLVMTGVHVLYRLKNVFFLNKGLMCFIVMFLLISCFITSLCACFQKDLKKVLAFSTSSNTGLIIISLLVNNSDNFIYLAITHGLFKSLCFIMSAFLFFSNKHNQDFYMFLQKRKTLFFSLITNSFLLLTALPISYFFVFKHHIVDVNFFSNYYCNVMLVTIFPILGTLSFIYSWRIVKNLISNVASGLKLKPEKKTKTKKIHKPYYVITSLFGLKFFENSNKYKYLSYNIFFFFWFVFIILGLCFFVQIIEIFNFLMFGLEQAEPLDALSFYLTLSYNISFIFIFIFMYREYKSLIKICIL